MVWLGGLFFYGYSSLPKLIVTYMYNVSTFGFKLSSKGGKPCYIDEMIIQPTKAQMVLQIVHEELPFYPSSNQVLQSSAFTVTILTYICTYIQYVGVL